MKCGTIKTLAMLLSLFAFIGCSKPESKIIGTWNNVQTQSSIQFNKDKSGVILQKTHPQLPPQIAFKWSMVKDADFLVQVPNGPEARGTLKDDDTIVLDNDTFKRAK